jgi:hypothetical protein
VKEFAGRFAVQAAAALVVEFAHGGFHRGVE